jgi:uncharacterized damage-inducible protein DinB
MKDHFRMFAAYNGWANERLYNAAAALDDDAYRRDVGAFFGSMHHTLNHILVGDHIWLNRFTGEGRLPGKLDEILHADFASLRAARETEDKRLIAWIGDLDEEELSGLISFTPITNPVPVTQHLAPALSHLFNHQTHHRGQAHTILSLLGREPPPLDLVYFLRSEAGSPFM